MARHARRAEDCLSLADFERLAAARLPRILHDYIRGWSDDGQSFAANRQAFADLAFVPRTFVDVSARDTAVTTLGERWRAPIGVAPMGGMNLAAFDADRRLARAAALEEVPFVLSGASLTPVEAVAHENPRLWFQLYADPDPATNLRSLQRIDAAGVRTLVVTADVPVPGNRELDRRNGYGAALAPSPGLLWDGLLHPRWLGGTLLRSLWRDGVPHFENMGSTRLPAFARQQAVSHVRDRVDWNDLQGLREQWPHRLVLKGLLAPHDLRRAAALGVDAVIASNHGGRQLDGALAPIDALAAMCEAAPGMPLMLDSGVRRGTDVLKALGLGAAHVFVGRPLLQATIAGGVEGARHALRLLRQEVDRGLALLGLVSAEDADGLARAVVRRPMGASGDRSAPGITGNDG